MIGAEGYSIVRPTIIKMADTQSGGVGSWKNAVMRQMPRTTNNMPAIILARLAAELASLIRADSSFALL